jgi:hypothetical protein
VGKRGGGAGVVVVQWTANTGPGFVQNMIRARSREQRAASGECDQDARDGTQGQAAARGQFALFDKVRALKAMVSEARSWEQGARSGRRDSGVIGYRFSDAQPTRLPPQAITA